MFSPECKPVSSTNCLTMMLADSLIAFFTSERLAEAQDFDVTKRKRDIKVSPRAAVERKPKAGQLGTKSTSKSQ